jgi:hypothetical protein
MNDDDSGTVFRDLIMLALLGFVTMVVLMLPHLYPPTEGDEETRPAGNLIVEMRWPDPADVDIDLWIKAPGDRAVSFQRKHGSVFDLLRDDLGFSGDSTARNFEFAFSRGLPAGEYIINVHWYSNRAGMAAPMPVSIIVTLVGAGSPRVITDRTVPVQFTGQEVTAIRFTVDDAGVVSGVHDFPKMLRPQRSTQ